MLPQPVVLAKMPKRLRRTSYLCPVVEILVAISALASGRGAKFSGNSKIMRASKWTDSKREDLESRGAWSAS